MTSYDQFGRNCHDPNARRPAFAWPSLLRKTDMTRIVHPVAGALALLTIATFWLSTVLSELFASEAAVVAVKTAIPWGFLLLIPALAATTGSGLAVAKGRRSGV